MRLQARRGGEILSETRLRFSYATGYKEPRLEETFAGPPYSIPNTSLKPERVRAFEAGLLFLRDAGFRAFDYKTIPHIYHRQPADEDRYALFLLGAQLIRRDMLSVVDRGNRGWLGPLLSRRACQGAVSAPERYRKRARPPHQARGGSAQCRRRADFPRL